jgi:hypothetical protein
MTRRSWVIVLIAAGVGLAILIGVLGTRNEPSASRADSVNALCNSLAGLGSSVDTLVTSTSTSQFQTNAEAVKASWTQVQSDFKAVQSAPPGQLESAWNAFTSSVKNAGSAGSASAAVSDIEQSVKTLASAAESAASSVHCT